MVARVVKNRTKRSDQAIALWPRSARMCEKGTQLQKIFDKQREELYSVVRNSQGRRHLDRTGWNEKRMHRNTLFVLITVMALPLPGHSAAVTAKKMHPNILIILADDMGWSDIGAYGGEINTPNLDALAANGMRFTQFYNASKCFTSRASLLTGLYAQQTGIGESPDYLRNAVTLATVLRASGYRTLMAGKHHGRDNPYALGFDRYFGLRDGAANHFNPGLPREGEPAPAQKRPGRRYWCIDDKCVRIRQRTSIFTVRMPIQNRPFPT